MSTDEMEAVSNEMDLEAEEAVNEDNLDEEVNKLEQEISAARQPQSTNEQM